jgi:hypothetical protein
MDSATAEKIMREIVENLPKGGISSGRAAGEAAQRALDAWIEAGAVPGDEPLYGLSVEEDEDTDGE